jgi:hypothetical protein
MGAEYRSRRTRPAARIILTRPAFHSANEDAGMRVAGPFDRGSVRGANQTGKDRFVTGLDR